MEQCFAAGFPECLRVAQPEVAMDIEIVELLDEEVPKTTEGRGGLNVAESFFGGTAGR